MDEEGVTIIGTTGRDEKVQDLPKKFTITLELFSKEILKLENAEQFVATVALQIKGTLAEIWKVVEAHKAKKRIITPEKGGKIAIPTEVL